jgi:hypothetical protein
MMEGRSA